MRAVAYLWRPQTRESMIESRALFENALALDPNFADAMAGLAWTYVYDYMNGWASPNTDYDAKIFKLTDRSTELVPNNAYAYAAKALYLILTNRADQALAVANAGLEHNPNSSILFLQRCLAESSLGRFEQARTDALEALKLEPRGPLTSLARLRLADAELGLGNYQAALETYRMAKEEGNADLSLYVGTAAAEALVGRTSAAEIALAEARRKNPQLTLHWQMTHGPNIPALFEGLRKAGLPDE